MSRDFCTMLTTRGEHRVVTGPVIASGRGPGDAQQGRRNTRDEQGVGLRCLRRGMAPPGGVIPLGSRQSQAHSCPLASTSLGGGLEGVIGIFLERRNTVTSPR
jgi:hypothetical protein